MKSERNRSQSKHRHRRRFGRSQDVLLSDPYKKPQKLSEPTVCPRCHAVYEDGRWKWATVPPGAAEEVCQACHRIRDSYPAGTVTLSGDYVRNPQHRSEILHLIRNQETAEKTEHPLNRIIGVQESEDSVVVTTTDVHLPRRIAVSVRDAHKGVLDMSFDENAYSFRAHWRRSD